MKKLILVLTLAAMLLPMVATAQGVKNCCQIKGNIKYENTTYNDNIWITEAAYVVDVEQSCGSAAIAGNCNDTSGVTNAASCITKRWGMLCILSTVNKVFNIVFYILIALTGIMIIAGAATIATAGGDPQKVTQGKNYIMYSMLGLVVALFAKAIPAVVMLLV